MDIYDYRVGQKVAVRDAEHIGIVSEIRISDSIESVRVFYNMGYYWHDPENLELVSDYELRKPPACMDVEDQIVKQAAAEIAQRSKAFEEDKVVEWIKNNLRLIYSADKELIGVEVFVGDKWNTVLLGEATNG